MQATAQPLPSITSPMLTPVFRDAVSLEPEPYFGNPGSCSDSPDTFVNDSTRISYLVGKLHDQVLRWVHLYLLRNSLSTCRYDVFLCEFKKTISHPVSEGSTAQRLLNLCQEQRSVADYLIDFHTAAAEAEWSAQALQGIFLQPNRKLLLIFPLDTLNTW